MEPRESTFEPTVIGAIWRYRALFGAIVAACIVLGVVFTALQPKEWSAVATLVVEDPRASSLFEQPVTGANADRYVENQVAVLRSQTIAQEVIGSPAVVALADPMDLTEFAGRLTVGSSPGSDVLTVGFIAGDPDVALASVNAVTEAYQSVLEDEATSTFAAAVEELGISIERWRSDLDQIQADIAEFTASDPSRAALADQYRASLERLVELQAELPTADSERSGQIRLELDDIAKSFATLQQLDAIEQESPELRALLEQQSEAVRQLSALAVLRDELSVDAELAGSGVVVVSPAEEVVPVTTGMARAAAVSLVIGVMIGAAVAYVLALRTQTFDDRLQPEAILEAGLLAEVPSFTEAGLRTQLPVRDAASTSTAESYRFLATALEMRSRAGGPVVDGDGTALPGGYALVRRRLRRARRRQDGHRGEHRPGGGAGRVQGPGGRRRLRRPGADPSPGGDRVAPVRTAGVGGRAHHAGEGARGHRVRRRPHRRASNDAGSAPPPRTRADDGGAGRLLQHRCHPPAAGERHQRIRVRGRRHPTAAPSRLCEHHHQHGAAGRGGGGPRQQGLDRSRPHGTGSS